MDPAPGTAFYVLFLNARNFVLNENVSMNVKYAAVHLAR